jgi:3-oxoadipate enol-lactonase
MTLHHETRGAGPPLLLLHAADLDGRAYAPLAERLEDRFTLVIPDQRGHGRTPLGSEPYAPAEDTLALLDELGIERAAVVGNSFGGRVALQLTTSAPDRVAALVLLASALPGHEPGPELKLAWEEETALWEAGDMDGVVAHNVRTWVREPAVADVVADMIRTAIERQSGGDEELERQLPVELGTIPVPVLAVTGGRDLPDFARNADRIAAEVPRAERAEVPDAGHLIALERPDATAALVADFLDRAGA